MNNNKQENKKTIELKQSFLGSAISDISTYIQLADTKVSIILASVVALLVGISACYEPIGKVVSNITPCSWIGILFTIFVILGIISIVLVFLFGILTIQGHFSIINYDSKWFLRKSTKEYSFEEFAKDVNKMTDEDIIQNMSAELYKLNDINRQKMKTMKWTLKSFSVLLCSILILFILFLVNVI